jgi:predicted GNAT family acetyltransferase
LQRIPPEALSAGIDAGRFWLWQSSIPVSMSAPSEVIEGVVGIAAVYTPSDFRKQGFAGSRVGHLSAQRKNEERQCILYTDLGNPVSNSVYRRLRYEAVPEVLHYTFDID